MRANPIGFGTLVKRELVRTYKVINQVVWPPIITTILYVLVFGLGLGSRVEKHRGRFVRGVPDPGADHAASDRSNLR